MILTKEVNIFVYKSMKEWRTGAIFHFLPAANTAERSCPSHAVTSLSTEAALACSLSCAASATWTKKTSDTRTFQTITSVGYIQNKVNVSSNLEFTIPESRYNSYGMVDITGN